MIFFRANGEHSWWNKATFHDAADFVLEVIKVVVISLAIIVPVRYFLIQPFYVKGASMEPNFYNHEYLIIDELSYRFNQPERGDIIVFRPPTQVNDFYIKRVIGLPGEQVSVANNHITITSEQYPQGLVLDESVYLPTSTTTAGAVNIGLGTDQYFVMGDNRSSSLDSRMFGPIERNSIVGKAWLRGWPIHKIAVFHNPQYNF